MLILRTVLSAAVLVAGFGIARAERKVDWSEFLEKPGERGPAIKHDDVAPVETKTKATKAKASAEVSKKKTAKAKRRNGAVRKARRK